jgi:hypothetical protein
MRLYSQGPAESFRRFVEEGCALELDRDALWTMRQLVEADILVMSKSSFAFVAALMSDGLKLFEGGLSAPLPDWLTCRRDGSFDVGRLIAQLPSPGAADPSGIRANEGSALS